MAKKGDWVTPAIQLIHALDQGAMGSVWVARHTTLGMDVAVKLIAEGVGKNANAVRRFKAEANHSAKIKSPHVIQVFDYGMTDDDAPYIVMELLLGECLADRLARDRILSPHDTALILTQAARGLHAAHKLNITHRDIKPENIFLQDDDGEIFVKILDFGIAKSRMVAGLTQPGAVLGTPAYMSREQVIDSRRVDHRTDLWSLAVVAYEALTGGVPFHGESIGELCAAVWCGEFDAPSQSNDVLNEDVDAWFAAALNPKMDSRPQSAKELASTFVRAVATIPEIFDEESMSDWQISGVQMVPTELSAAATAATDVPLSPAEAAALMGVAQPSDPQPKADEASLVKHEANTVDSASDTIPAPPEEPTETMSAVIGPTAEADPAIPLFRGSHVARNVMIAAVVLGFAGLVFAISSDREESLSAPAAPATETSAPERPAQEQAPPLAVTSPPSAEPSTSATSQPSAAAVTAPKATKTTEAKRPSPPSAGPRPKPAEPKPAAQPQPAAQPKPGERNLGF